jgi:ribosomal protein S18 acetylase RimI-like enzyme
MDDQSLNQIELRYQPRAGDRPMVERIVRRTGKFNEEEIGVALELLDAALEQGASSGYEFVFAQPQLAGGKRLPERPILGYACFGKIPGTERSFDLYWVVVDPAVQGLGIGKRLLLSVEQQVLARRGSQLYIETSARPDYRGTRKFYAASGYSVVAELSDFYAPGDHKVIYHKKL